MINRVPEELWTEIRDIIRRKIKNILKCKQAKEGEMTQIDTLKEERKQKTTEKERGRLALSKILCSGRSRKRQDVI